MRQVSSETLLMASSPSRSLRRKARHHADHVGASFDEDDAGVVADGFECTGLVGDFQIGGQVAGNPGTLVGAQHFEEVGGRFFVQELAVVDGIEQGHHFVRSGDVFAAFFRGLQVHHFAAQAGVGEAERVEHGVHVLHADAVDQDVGRGVVADCDHHRGQVAQGDARYAGRQSVHDVAVGDQVGRLHGVEIGELELALLRPAGRDWRAR